MLTQKEADAFLCMNKKPFNDKEYSFTMEGESFRIPLFSQDRREEFSLDITRSYVRLNKMSYNHRVRKVICLARIDLVEAPAFHMNPDGNHIDGPHFHTYKEGYGDKWAFPLPERFDKNKKNPYILLQDFMDFCNIHPKPKIKKNLFS